MSLMTDDIEWYPLPEVLNDTLIAVDTKSSCTSLSTTVSHSSTTLSLSYLTPASSVASCRSHSRSAHLTGTIQPYLKRPTGEDHAQRRAPTPKHGRTGAVHSCQSQSSIRTSSSVGTASVTEGRQAGSLKQTTLSVPMQTSSAMTFKTAKSSSAPSLKHRNSTSAFQPTSSITQATAPPFHGHGQSDVAEHIESSVSVHSAQQSETTQPTVSGSSRGQLPHSLIAPQDTVITSSMLPSPALSQGKTCPKTTTASASSSVSASSYLPSRIFATGVKLPLDPKQQQTTISLAELDQLWMDFLASSLGSARRSECLPGSEVHVAPMTSPPADRQPSTQEEEHSLREVVLSETRDTGIQTTPSLTSHDHHSFHQLSTAHQQPCLSELTLQESLKTLRPDFIHRCEQRQRDLRRNHELRSHAYCKETTGKPSRLSNSHITGTRKEAEKTQRSPHFILIDVNRNRPKMSPVEMYQNSKKYWCKLPEVQQKVQEQRRESEAVTNRLRMKIYQKEVLRRLRSKNKK